MQTERVAGVEIINSVWLAEFLAMARIGDEWRCHDCRLDYWRKRNGLHH